MRRLAADPSLMRSRRDGAVWPTGDACGAIATQMAAKLKKADRINEKRFRVGKKLGEYELLAVCCVYSNALRIPILSR